MRLTLLSLLALLLLAACPTPRTGNLDDDDDAADDDDSAVGDDDDTTSGDPVDPPDAMVGETYCLDWSTANITDPPDIATLLGIAGIDLNDYRILLNPTAVDDAGGTMDLLGAAASAGTCTQDLTLETFALDDATWTNPHFESQPTDLSFNAGPDIGTLSLLGAVLAGDFAITPSTDQIVNSSMDGWLDVSNLSGACFVLTCVTCPTGAGDCAAFAFDSAVWDATGNGPLTPVP